ncbi:unnamed protein product [Lactuca saligna]|uniref:GDSL esterase/lipase n=1 Tax=Lactuca saligna TaxID=75948 RepID=A0AA35ZGZ6_LACSI|nr:unnamed protein product [Lactuca saligna]
MSFWWLLSTIFIVMLYRRTCMAKNFSAIFVFGDSLVDVGNNNYIPSLAKADHDPIGVDFGKATGRFTNGRTVTDILGQVLGFKNFPPPYLAPTTVGPVVLQGVNYASGASGILDESGANYIGRIPMDAQLDNFAKTRLDIISSIGAPASLKLFATALFQVTTSSNDFINNYFLPSLIKNQPPPETFVETLISAFRRQLTKLYDLGARKIIVTNAPPVGCIPYERDYNPSTGKECVASQNLVAQQFNQLLKGMLIELTATLKGSTFVYADVYGIVDDIIQNYKSYDFEIADSACCHVLGSHGGLLPCLPYAKICPDRSKYIFWDSYHVTDSVNVIIAKRLLDGDLNDISPLNIRALSHS